MKTSRAWFGLQRDRGGPVYAETFQGKVPRALRSPDLKLIYNQNEKTFEYYGLIADPAEKNNLHSPANASLDSMTSSLEQLMSQPPRALAGSSVEVDAETLKQLKDLGYVGD